MKKVYRELTLKDSLIQSTQKFLNRPFRYLDMEKYFDGMRAILLTDKSIDETEKNEYNSLWDLIEVIESRLQYAKDKNWCVGIRVSVEKTYEKCYNQRK